MKNIHATKLIADILTPKVPHHFKKQHILLNFHCFLSREPINETYLKTLDNLLDNSFIKNALNIFEKSPVKFGKRGIYTTNDMSPERLVFLFTTALKKNNNPTSAFELLKEEVSTKIIQGRYTDAIELLDRFDDTEWKSLWSLSIKTKINTLNKNNEPSIENPKFENLLCDSAYKIAYEKQIAIDASAYLDNAIRRRNREFINARALAFSGFNALMYLPYPFYEQANSLSAIMKLQNLSLIDLYDRLGEILKQHYFSLEQEENPVAAALECEKTNSSSFHFLKNINKEMSPDAVKMINLYDKGDYESIITILENEYLQLNDIMSNLNIFAKSYIYLNKKPAKNLPSILLSCITQLINIHLFQNTNTAIQQLISIASKLQPLDIYRHILIAIIKAAPCYFNKDIRNKIISSSAFLYSPHHKINDLDFPSINSIVTADGETNEILQAKNKIITSVQANRFEDAGDLLSIFEKSTPILKDYIELMVYYLSKMQDKNKLIEFTALTLIEKPQSYISFPLDDIISFIKEEELFNLESVTIAYIYNNNKKQKIKDVFNDTYEAFFLTSNIEKFSHLFENSHQLSKMESFLLREICSIENMEYLGIFPDEMDLILERIKIITHLYNISEISSDSFETEFAELVEYIAISSGAAKLTTAKIFVDCDNIYKQNKPEIDDLLSLHCKINNSVPEHDDKLDTENLLADDNEDGNALTRIASLLRRDYINHPDFGLDKTLSSEIRHGFFSNLMCSKLQERKLLCELDENGKFVNKYWIDYYPYVNRDIIQQIHELLRKFTAEFYQIIEDAEKWMKASLVHDSTSAFNFTYDQDDTLIVIHKIRKNGVNNYPFYIMDILNERLHQSLYNIKSKLNIELADKVDALFNRLIGEITQKKQLTSLTDMMDNIYAVQDETKESIRTACEWFNLKKDISFDPYPVGDIIKLAVRCYSQIAPTSISIKHDVDENINEISVPGEHISAIVKTIINFLNNAIRHGSNKDKIIISAKSKNNSDGGYTISIINSLSCLKKSELEGGLLTQIKEKLSVMNSNELLIKEGGSGLYKSKYELIRCDSRFNLVVDCVEHNFMASIIYEI